LGRKDREVGAKRSTPSRGVAAMTGIDPQATTKADARYPSLRHGTFKLGGVHCRGCADAVERALRAEPHLTGIRLDWKNDVVRVGYDPTSIDSEDIEKIITQTGCDCAEVEAEGGQRETVAPPERRMQHLGHGVDAQPISMGTKHDRMQYEMPATHADHGDHMGH